MKRFLALAVAMLVAGCDSPADKLAASYKVATNPNDQCNLAKEAAQAYLRENNAEQYKKWTDTADMDCAGARLWNMRADQSHS